MKKCTFVFSIILLFCNVILSAEPASADTFPPSLDSVAIAHIDTAMIYSGTTRLDTEFEKKWSSDTLFRLPIVDRLLDKPLELPDTIDSWTRFLLDHHKNKLRLVEWCFENIDCELSSRQINRLDDKIEKAAGKLPMEEGIPEPYSQALNTILASYDIAWEYRVDMLEKVSEKSLDSLLYLLPMFWTDSEDTLDDTLACFFLNLLGHECDTSLDIHLDSLYITMHNIDIEKLGMATVSIVVGLERAVEILSSGDSLPALSEPKIIDTRWGRAIIGTRGLDIFGSAAIIIDPGGNDLYIGRHGAGTLGMETFGVVLDMAGDDHYDSRGEIFSQASGIFGVGAMVDLEGNDIYSCSHYGQGAGLFGSGLLIDLDGDDIYSGGVFVQGCGNFGMGILIDECGEDGYRSWAYAQGFAGPKGIGFIFEADGSDQYFSGGKYSHAPLAPFDYHSFAQGFAIGWRPDVSGGIGCLLDRAGNDTYSAGVYSQGVSYWYSLAMLIDNSGNDVYTSVWYPQGSGIHLSVGSLVDRSGNDIYVSPQGPGQGSAHDYSVGFFSDYCGDDIYVIDGGNGTALTNSFSLFVDRNGDDMYSRRFSRSGNWALARGARGTGSFGIFLDLEGTDHYSDPDIAEDNSFWFQGDIGFGLDFPGDPFPDPVKELSEELAEEEPDSDKTIEDIFNEASAWGVGSARDKAEKAFQELLDSAETAAEFICEEVLDTKSSLRLRTIKRFSSEKPDLMRPCLFKALRNDDRKRRGNAIYLFGEMADTTAVDSLIPLLKDKNVRIGIISALGKIGDTTAVPYIMKYHDDKRQPVRYMVSKSLSDLKDPRSIPALIDFLGDDYLTVRIAAQNGLAKMSDHSLDTLLQITESAEIPNILHVLRAISSISKSLQKDTELEPEVLEQTMACIREILVPLLEQKDPVIRGHTVRTLGIIGGEKTIAEMQRLYELESNPFVRSMFEKAFER